MEHHNVLNITIANRKEVSDSMKLSWSLVRTEPPSLQIIFQICVVPSSYRAEERPLNHQEFPKMCQLQLPLLVCILTRCFSQRDIEKQSSFSTE